MALCAHCGTGPVLVDGNVCTPCLIRRDDLMGSRWRSRLPQRAVGDPRAAVAEGEVRSVEWHVSARPELGLEAGEHVTLGITRGNGSRGGRTLVLPVRVLRDQWERVG